MEPHHLFPLPILRLNSSSISASFCFLLLLLAVPSSHNQEDDYNNCKKPFTCGLLDDLSYPFWGGKRPVTCGRQGYELKCQEGEYPLLVTQPFRVLYVNQSSGTMTIARDDYFSNGVCQETSSNITLDTTGLLVYDPSGFENMSIFYNCNQDIVGVVPVPYQFTCPNNSGVGFYANDGLLRLFEKNLSMEATRYCERRVEVPVQAEVKISARSSPPSTGRSPASDAPSPPSAKPSPASEAPSPPSAGPSHRRKKLVIGLIVGGVTMLIILSIAFGLCKLYRKGKGNKENDEDIKISRNENGNKENDEDIKTFISNCGTLAIKRYRFKEIKKMTDSFKDKLGEGGFGSVYKGRLFDGHLIAVKVLKASKGNGAEFLNELASISRTSHVNIVTLLGYCFESNKRVLIYEFMPNGSLDKFIHNANPTGMHLDWRKLFEIATGVARGLEYLHRGCNTRIVHFDIKPHNILLDDDFHPKISDFGLAKLSNARESIMSMLETRGTVGYIAPEVFNRNFGGVSSKSDVYSYGMLLLDIVGATQRDCVQVEGASGSSNCYFPNWIYKQIELEKYDFFGPLTMEEMEVVKRMTLVGLWCIQTIPSSRPKMTQVIEMLEGNMRDLKIPPKPFLFSPPRLLPPSSSTSTTEA